MMNDDTTQDDKVAEESETTATETVETTAEVSEEEPS